MFPIDIDPLPPAPPLIVSPPNLVPTPLAPPVAVIEEVIFDVLVL